MEHLLNFVNTLELLNKIDKFKKLDLKETTMAEISNRSLETLNCMLVSSCNFASETFLFRIRKLENEFRNRPEFFQDIWHPKAEWVTKMGRANLEGEPILYCSTDQVTPLYECGIVPGDCYAIIQYKVKPGKELIGYCVGSDGEVDGLNQTGLINHKIITDFIVSEFTKPVGIGTEYLYKVSNVICRNFLDMPFCDAYVYPSVANYKRGWNVAIKPQSALEKIEFDCVLLCEFKEYAENKDCLFEIKHKANAIVDGRLKYVF